MNYLKNVLDSMYKSLAPANIRTKIEMNILVRFEVIQISKSCFAEMGATHLYTS